MAVPVPASAPEKSSESANGPTDCGGGGPGRPPQSSNAMSAAAVVAAAAAAVRRLRREYRRHSVQRARGDRHPRGVRIAARNKHTTGARSHPARRATKYKNERTYRYTTVLYLRSRSTAIYCNKFIILITNNHIGKIYYTAQCSIEAAIQGISVSARISGRYVELAGIMYVYEHELYKWQSSYSFHTSFCRCVLSTLRTLNKCPQMEHL